jgi:hypothetical protein
MDIWIPISVKNDCFSAFMEILQKTLLCKPGQGRRQAYAPICLGIPLINKYTYLHAHEEVKPTGPVRNNCLVIFIER